MGGFLSFLAPDDSESLIDTEWLDVFGTQVDELIFSWLRKYIRIYNPGYTFEEVAGKINAVDISNESIQFQLLNPHTHKYERFRFGVDILEYIQRETQKLMNRTFYDSRDIEEKIFSVTPETLSVIQTWYPYITPENILEIDILPLSNHKSKANLLEFPSMKITYFIENEGVRQKILPSIRKWEFKGTVRGAMHVMGMERGRILRLLTQKNNLD